LVQRIVGAAGIGTGWYAPTPGSRVAGLASWSVWGLGPDVCLARRPRPRWRPHDRPGPVRVAVARGGPRGQPAGHLRHPS